MSRVIVDKGEHMLHLGEIEAYMLNSDSGLMECYKNQHEKVAVDTSVHRVFVADYGVRIACVKDGVMRLVHAK